MERYMHKNGKSEVCKKFTSQSFYLERQHHICRIKQSYVPSPWASHLLARNGRRTDKAVTLDLGPVKRKRIKGGDTSLHKENNSLQAASKNFLILP